MQRLKEPGSSFHPLAPFIAEALGATRMKYYNNFDWKKALQRDVCMIGKARELLREISREKDMKTEQTEGEAREVKRERSIEGGRGKGRKKAK